MSFAEAISKISYIFTDLEMKSVDGNFYIEGIASSVNKDLGNDVITEECLHEMKDKINQGNIKLGFDHTELLAGRPTLEAVGRLIEAKVGEGKLFVKGILDNTFSHFEEIKHKIKNKFIDGMSIEYQVNPDKTIEDFKSDGVRHRVISGLNSLIGVALTPRPMNPDALFDYYEQWVEIEGEKLAKEASHTIDSNFFFEDAFKYAVNKWGEGSYFNWRGGEYSIELMNVVNVMGLDR